MAQNNGKDPRNRLLRVQALPKLTKQTHRWLALKALLTVHIKPPGHTNKSRSRRTFYIAVSRMMTRLLPVNFFE